MSANRDAVLDRYRRYLDVCNRHAFDELSVFLAETVRVNGFPRTPREYTDDLLAVHRAFPDYHWALQRAVHEDPWLAVHLRNTGTHLGPWRGAAATGRPVATEECAMYRFESDRIAEVWVIADNARLPL
jgi:predicted ester cyclase